VFDPGRLRYAVSPTLPKITFRRLVVASVVALRLRGRKGVGRQVRYAGEGQVHEGIEGDVGGLGTVANGTSLWPLSRRFVQISQANADLLAGDVGRIISAPPERSSHQIDESRCCYNDAQPGAFDATNAQGGGFLWLRERSRLHQLDVVAVSLASSEERL
jgi:hypothetical protein